MRWDEVEKKMKEHHHVMSTSIKNSGLTPQQVWDRFLEEQETKDNNPIEPSHYVDMKISPLEFIEANQEVLTWCTSNVIKYVGRHQRKNGLEDLRKAAWYLNHEIERLEKGNNEKK